MKKYKKGDVINEYIGDLDLYIICEDDNNLEWKVYIKDEKFHFRDCSLTDVLRELWEYDSAGEFDEDEDD